MPLDRNGNEKCEWCGGPMPDHRLGHETCGGVCQAELAADRARELDNWLSQLRLARKDADKVAKRRHYARKMARRAEDCANGRCVTCRRPNPEPKYKHCPTCRAAALEAVQRCRDKPSEAQQCH